MNIKYIKANSNRSIFYQNNNNIYIYINSKKDF